MLLLAHDTLDQAAQAQSQARVTVLCSYSHSAFLYPEVHAHDCMNECTSTSQQSKLNPLFNTQMKKSLSLGMFLSNCASDNNILEVPFFAYFQLCRRSVSR